MQAQAGRRNLDCPELTWRRALQTFYLLRIKHEVQAGAQPNDDPTQLPIVARGSCRMGTPQLTMSAICGHHKLIFLHEFPPKLHKFVLETASAGL